MKISRRRALGVAMGVASLPPTSLVGEIIPPIGDEYKAVNLHIPKWACFEKAASGVWYGFDSVLGKWMKYADEEADLSLSLARCLAVFGSTSLVYSEDSRRRLPIHMQSRHGSVRCTPMPPPYEGCFFSETTMIGPLDS